MLNPAEPVWPATLKASLLLAWFIASGLPIAWAVFGGRASRVWPGYAPIVGLGLHLLTFNLLSWAAPGALGSWLGLAAAALISGAVLVRACPRPRLRLWPRSAYLMLAASAVLVGGALYLGIANRTQVLFTDEPWHLPLAATMARGIFPPISPFSPHAGAAYHYGADLLAAQLINLAGAAPWTAFYLLSPVVAVVLGVTAGSAARDFGSTRVVAVATGLVAGFAGPGVGFLLVGLPTVFESASPGDGLGDALLRLGSPTNNPLFLRLGPVWLNLPHFALGLALLVLMAAAAHGRLGAGRAAVFGVAFGLLPLAETAAFVIGAVATAVFVAVELVRATRRARIRVIAAAAGGFALAIFAGGIVTDVLFRGAGGPGGRLALSADAAALALGQVAPAGGLNLLAGPLALVLVLGAAAVGLRSRGLGFLALAAAGGLATRQIVSPEVSGIDTRLLDMPYTLVAWGALIGVGALAARVRRGWLALGAGALVAAVVAAPTVVPRAVASVDIASQGVDLDYPTVHDPVTRYANPTRFARALGDEWPALDWMRQRLPDDARVLAADPPLVSLATGLAAPMSGPGLVLFNPLETPAFLDATEFLAGADLRALGVTHVYVTPKLEDGLDRRARAALTNGERFRLLFEQSDAAGRGWRVYEARPSARDEPPAASSFQRLADVAAEVPAVTVAGTPSASLRQTLVLAFPEDTPVFGPATYVPRTSVRAEYKPLTPVLAPGLLIVADTYVPTTLGLDRADARWRGHGLRAYATAAGWSPTWRPEPGPSPVPDGIAAGCEDSSPGVELRFIGDPGDALLVGSREISLSGVPQSVRVAADRCADVEVGWRGAGVTPFVQIRPAGPAASVAELARPASASAGLGFDGGVTDDGTAVINLWYRNPDRILFGSGTEFRLYRTSGAGLIDAASPAVSAAWWDAPFVLASDLETGRFEFVAATGELIGVGSGVRRGPFEDGVYVLAFTVVDAGGPGGDLRFHRVVPVLNVQMSDGVPSYRPLSGIVEIGEGA